MNVPTGWGIAPNELINDLYSECERAVRKGYGWDGLDEAMQKIDEAYAAAPAAPVAAPAPSEWVSVADRLPAMDVQVLVFCPNNNDPRIEFEEWVEYHEDPIGFGGPTICTGEGWSNNEYEEISHWMPLPAHPVADPYAGIAADFASPAMLTTRDEASQ